MSKNMVEGMIEKMYTSKAIVKSNFRQPWTVGPKAASLQVRAVLFMARNLEEASENSVWSKGLDFAYILIFIEVIEPIAWSAKTGSIE
jgi:hypothetical protein